MSAIALGDQGSDSERKESKEFSKRKHDTIVLGKRVTRGSNGTPSYGSSGSQSPNAPQDQPRKAKGKKHKGSKSIEVARPTATLFHLYRKRDRIHGYTTDPNRASAMRNSDGYKDRLSPGLVFTEQEKGTVRVPVSSNYGSIDVYVYAKDQGDDAVPLYHLTGKAGRSMVTSWEHIRDAWIGKGWTSQGIVGYIYRP